MVLRGENRLLTRRCWHSGSPLLSSHLLHLHPPAGGPDLPPLQDQVRATAFAPVHGVTWSCPVDLCRLSKSDFFHALRMFWLTILRRHSQKNYKKKPIKLSQIVKNTKFVPVFLFCIHNSKFCADSQTYCAIVRLHDCSFYKLRIDVFKQTKTKLFQDPDWRRASQDPVVGAKTSTTLIVHHPATTVPGIHS